MSPLVIFSFSFSTRFIATKLDNCKDTLLVKQKQTYSPTQQILTNFFPYSFQFLKPGIPVVRWLWITYSKIGWSQIKSLAGSP